MFMTQLTNPGSILGLAVVQQLQKTISIHLIINYITKPSLIPSPTSTSC